MNPINKIGQIYLRTNIKVFGAFFSAPIDAQRIRPPSRPISYVSFLYTYIELLLFCSVVYGSSKKNTMETKDQRKAATTSIKSIVLIINWWKRALLLIVWAVIRLCVWVSFLIKKFNSPFMYGDLDFFPFNASKSFASCTCKCNQSEFRFFVNWSLLFWEIAEWKRTTTK